VHGLLRPGINGSSGRANAVRINDQRRHAVGMIAITRDAMAKPDRVGPEPLQRHLVEQHLQLPAMHRVLRPAVAREQAARLRRVQAARPRLLAAHELRPFEHAQVL